MGFAHQGGGWKNREFFGHIYSFDVVPTDDDDDQGFASHELANEFWSLLADSTNQTVWVYGDERIKGFSAIGGAFSTSYVFHVADKLEVKDIEQSGDNRKRRKLESNQMWHGNNVHRMIVFGSERIGYLDNNVIQERKLNETNCHDGVHREVAMDNIEEDIAQWPKEDVLNLSDSTWMDDTGSAEVTIGKKPDSVRFVDIATPSSVGYLSDNKLAFAHERSSHIAIYDHELRKTSGLVGFGSDGIKIVQRPTFEAIGEENAFVASDETCVKIFDLRSGKAEMTIHQKCLSSTPMYLSDAKFLCNKLGNGRGAQIWDLRANLALYSLPVSWQTDVAFVPAPRSPILLTSNGECYKYGVDLYTSWDEHSYAKRKALKAWASLEKERSSGDGDGGDCSIM